VVLSLFLKI